MLSISHYLSWKWLVALGLVAVAVGLPAWDWYDALPEGIEAEYVGRDSCIRCHQEEFQRWENSDHDMAMDFATPEFVLGDFDDTQLEHHGITSRMSRRGDEYFVETEGPDGEITEFSVKYVYGVRPLQQYLTELEGGRVQVLPVTWDTEEKRWFYANPDAPFGPGDPLHWTGSAQNWNHMCADCHSTNFKKNYDVKTNIHHYSYSEMDVSCEACHGPGSLHIELAESKSLFWDRNYGYGLVNLKEKSPRKQLETCAPCHSRRSRLADGFKPGDFYSDYYSLALLDENLYHADGQINDEVYVYGSFMQSLMYRKDVRCTDCHDPHTTRIKFEGNKLCAQCHLPAKFDTPVHHHHKVGSQGAQCVECHMPSKKYMVVDPRRDHSIRIPRPDLTVKIGTPNACNNCHNKPDETAEWAAEKVVEWYGPKRKYDPHFGEILAAGREGQPEAKEALVDLTSSKDVGPIVQATAASLLATRYPHREIRGDMEKMLDSRNELVRAAILSAFENWPINSPSDFDAVHDWLAPKFRDSRRLVRTEAGRVSLRIPQNVFNQDDIPVMEKAVEEYKRSILLNADQAGAHMTLGVLYSNMGDTSAAMHAYRTAMKLDSEVAGPRSNLAQMLESQGKADEARRLREEEAVLLERDAELLPDQGILHYRLGLLHYVLGNQEKAIASLKKAVEAEPRSTEFLTALTLLYEKYQLWSEALEAAKDLVRISPDPQSMQILRNIEAKAQ